MEIGGYAGGRVRAVLGAVFSLALVSTPGVASAVTFKATCAGTTGDVPSLIAAIGSANSSPGPDTVALGPGCTYTLTAVNNNWYGPNGLPPIASDITIEGNGSTIARSATAPRFRLFFVGADPLSAGTDQYVSPGPGVLTVKQVTLTGGVAKGGDSDGGGGGAGMGGAIFSQGVVTVDHSTIAGNAAQGGSAVNNSAGLSGGGIGTDSSANAGGGFGAGSFGGGAGGGSNSGGGGGGADFRVTENGNSADMTGKPGPGGGPLTGTGGFGGNSNTQSGVAGGDGGGGGGRGPGADGGAFGAGGTKPVSGGGSAGGGIGGGGSQYADVDSGGGGGGFGGGGGTGSSTTGGGSGGSGGFGGGGGYGPGGGGGAGFGGGTATTTGGGGGGAGLGGAIFNMQGQLTIVDSTLTANTALGGADNVTDHARGIGGGVFNLSGSFSATASTFFANTAAGDGASIYNLVYDGATARTAQATLTDTIVAGGQGPFQLTSDRPAAVAGATNLGTAAADVSQFDLIRTMRTVGTGSIFGSPLTLDPLLGPLQNNGGPTQTMAPASGSPVIDAGGACTNTDQRGQPRSDNGETACDIGAYEVQDPPGGGGGGGSGLAIVSGEKLSPTAFAAAPSGPAALATRRRFGTKVSYTLNLSASVRFTVVHPQAGRRAKGSHCVKATRRNRRARRCTLLVTIRGSFTLRARAGANSFRFTGRLGARKLTPGSYRLIAHTAHQHEARATGQRVVQDNPVDPGRTRARAERLRSASTAMRLRPRRRAPTATPGGTARTQRRD